MNSSRQTMVSVTNFRHANTDEVAQVSYFNLQDESSNKENESVLPVGQSLWRNTSSRSCPSTEKPSSFKTDTLVRNPDATISTPCATAGSNQEVICRSTTKADHVAQWNRPLQVLGQFQSLEVIPATDKVLTSISPIETCVHSKDNVVQTPIHEQSDSTSSCASKENERSKGVKRLETETRMVDSNDVINTMGAFPMNTEYDSGFHVSPPSFVSDHLSERGEQEARSPHCNAKYPVTHYPVIPLADVTEAYTDLQGGWMLPFQTKPNFQRDIITKTLDDDSAKIPLHSLQAQKIRRNSKDCENIFKNDELEYRYRRHTQRALTDAKPSNRLPSHTTRGLLRI